MVYMLMLFHINLFYANKINNFTNTLRDFSLLAYKTIHQLRNIYLLISDSLLY
jgi:hypothetical protein